MENYFKIKSTQGQYAMQPLLLKDISTLRDVLEEVDWIIYKFDRIYWSLNFDFGLDYL